jgi:hypothetical protein
VKGFIKIGHFFRIYDGIKEKQYNFAPGNRKTGIAFKATSPLSRARGCFRT